VPTSSTKHPHEAEATAGDVDGRLEAVRQRISEGFYDRAEVRRTIASLLLRNLARRSRRPGSAHPETA
jgi:hypothetical protein